jgi:hypothetical protein
MIFQYNTLLYQYTERIIQWTISEMCITEMIPPSHQQHYNFFSNK